MGLAPDRARELIDDLRDQLHQAYPVGAATANDQNKFNDLSADFDLLLAEYEQWTGVRDRAADESEPEVDLLARMHKTAEEMVGLIRHVRLEVERMEDIVVDVRGLLSQGVKR